MAAMRFQTPVDIPVFSYWRQHDDLAQFAQILREHDSGYFFRSSMLVDELMTDDRIQGVTETRIGELLSAPFKIEPASDKRKARKLAEEIGGTDGYSGVWETIASPTTLATLLKWGIYLGVAVAAIEWNRTPERSTPRLVPWHPSNLYWDDWRKAFVMNTMDAGQIVLPRPDRQPYGDGQWFVWCPYGVQYGWRSGMIRSIGEVYLSRRYAKRDFNRWTETRALGILKAKVPGAAKPEEKDAYRADVANAASDTVVVVPQSTDGKIPGYDLEGVNLDGAGGTSWNGIKGLIDDCNDDISVLLLGGNLNTDMGEGSLAAAKSQRKNITARSLRDASVAPEISRQVLYHYADLNYDTPDLAPVACYEVLPPEDEEGEASAMKLLGEGLSALITASPRVDVDAILEGAGVPMITEEELAAKQEEEAQRRADAAAEAGASEEPVAAEEADDPEAGSAPAAEGNPKSGARAALGMIESVRARRRFQGLDIAIENPATSIREWTDDVGRVGHTRMQHDYGFIEGFVGADKEEIDCYLGPCEDAEHVFVVRQMGPVGVGGRWCYDEDKVMFGFPSAEAAKAAFLAHRDDGDRAFGGIVMHTVKDFRARLNRRRRHATTRIAAAADPARALVALAARARAKPGRTMAGSRRQAKYQEVLQRRLVQKAQAIMQPDLAAIRDVVASVRAQYGAGAAVTPQVAAEAKRRLLRRFGDADPAELARVITVGNVMANLSGRDAALSEV